METIIRELENYTGKPVVFEPHIGVDENTRSVRSARVIQSQLGEHYVTCRINTDGDVTSVREVNVVTVRKS